MHQKLCSEIELVASHQNWASFGSSSNITLVCHTEMRPRAGFKLIACENYGMFGMLSSIQANLGIFSFSE